MKILFILRKEIVPNLFREIILEGIKSYSNSEIIICSGFFSENKNFKVSQELGRSMKNKQIKLTTIGVYNSYWKNEYIEFINNLKNFNLKEYRAFISKKRWHAKLFFLKYNSDYKIAIIGSSNLTSSAFGIKNPFNIECDVIFWDERDSRINSLIIENLTKLNGEDYIISNQDEKLDKIPIEKKLKDLERKLFDKNLIEIKDRKNDEADKIN